MTIQECVEALYRLDSDQDPITYRGKETTPQELHYELNDLQPASGIRIGYYAKKGWIQNGTLTGMLADRKRLEKRNA